MTSTRAPGTSAAKRRTVARFASSNSPTVNNVGTLMVPSLDVTSYFLSVPVIVNSLGPCMKL